MKEKMTEDEILEFITRRAREISRPTNRPRRRQPKHKGGLVSWRQNIALQQTSNPIKAMYTEDANPTPIRVDTEGLTREVGPGQPLNPQWAEQKIGRGESGHA